MEIKIEDGEEMKDTSAVESGKEETADTQDAQQEAESAQQEQEADTVQQKTEDGTETAAESDTDSEDTEKTQEEAAGDDDGEAAEEKTEEKSASDGKHFFRRKDKEKDALKDEVAKLKDQVVRQMAEFDNYRKRTDKEKESMFSMGEKSVIEKMLPVVDNFERALATVPEEEKEEPFAKGVDMIYQQLVKQLTDLGVKPIEAEGKEFDPNYHNAVMQVDSDTLESGTVAKDLQKGYTFHDQVIRHSMVSVVK